MIGTESDVFVQGQEGTNRVYEGRYQGVEKRMMQAFLVPGSVSVFGVCLCEVIDEPIVKLPPQWKMDTWTLNYEAGNARVE